MNGLRARWDQLNTPVKIVVAVVAVVIGGLLLLELFPYLIGVLGIAGFFALFAVPYFLPSIIAFVRRHPSKWAIVALNTFLGWTFLGWLIALIWALSNNSSANPTVIVNNTTNVASGDGAVAVAPPPPPAPQIGDVVNGHRFDGTQWVPLALEGTANREALSSGPGSGPEEVAWIEEGKGEEEKRD